MRQRIFGMLAMATALPFLSAGCTATRTTYVDPYGAPLSTGMHWTAYEVFSVISGVILIICTFAPRVKTRDRFWAFFGGVAFIVYAIYTGHQIEGTYSFPVAIFIIPVVAVLWILAAVFGLTGTKAAPPSREARDRDKEDA
jgi:hypothetical protein